MAPCKGQFKTKRHLVCNDRQSWVDFALSGCTTQWAERRWIYLPVYGMFEGGMPNEGSA